MSSTIYEYSDDCRVIRHDYDSGKKTFCPQHRNRGRWIKGAPAKPWPLFQGGSLPLRGVIFVVEGEKCAEAMLDIGLAATTSLCGSGSAQYSDWSPLAERDVVIIPDNDVTGTKYADEVASAIRSESKDARIRILKLPGLKVTEDVEDFIRRHRNNCLKPAQIKKEIVKRVEHARRHEPGGTAANSAGKGRNNELTSLAGKLRWNGLSEEALVAALFQANEDRFDDPLPKDEIQRIARSVSRYDLGTQPASRTTSEFQPFPTSALPRDIRQYVVEAAAAIGCDPSYIVTPLLSCLGAAIGPTHRIELKPGWSEYTVIWSLIVGKSGTQKSPALDAAVRFLREADSENARQFKAAMVTFAELYDEWYEAHENWETDGGSGDEPCEPEQPRLLRHICSDVTIEAAAQLLDDNERGLLLFRDEMNAWIGSFGRYSGAGTADVSSWLELFGCRPLTIDRKTGDRRTIRVERPFLCITGSIQPSTLKRALKDEHFENGLAARLLLACPPPSQRVWTNRSASQDSIEKARRVFQNLLSLKAHPNKSGEREPRDVVLSDKAHQLWVSFFNEHQRKGAALGEAEAAAWSKLEAYAARIALVISLTRFVSDEKGTAQSSIDGESMRMAIEIVRWYGEEALRVYAILRESKDEAEHRDLVDVVRRHGGRITANQLRNASRRFTTNDEAKHFLDALVEAGRGKWEKQRTTRKGGRPTRIFILAVPSTETKTKVLPRSRKKVSGNGRRPQPLTRERWQRVLAHGKATGFLKMEAA